jgi:biotin transport system substrate-specific component
MSLYSTLATGARRGALVDAAMIVAGSVLLTLSAKIAIPFYPVPMTMQTFVVIALGLSLGPARGAAAVVLYLIEGASGLPVFTGTPAQGIGLAYMAGPTGGFLAGFVLAALVAGWLAERGWGREPLTAMAAAMLAAAVIYVPGLLWLGTVIGFDKPILTFGLYPFIWGDVAKALLAAVIFPAAWRWALPR